MYACHHVTSKINEFRIFYLLPLEAEKWTILIFFYRVYVCMGMCAKYYSSSNARRIIPNWRNTRQFVLIYGLISNDDKRRATTENAIIPLLLLLLLTPTTSIEDFEERKS